MSVVNSWRPSSTCIPSESVDAFSALGVIHGFAIRQPGVDVDAEREQVLTRLAPSHDALLSELGLAGRLFCTGAQVHGAGVAVVDSKTGAFYPGVDALITADAGVCLGIYAADCCAVFLADPASKCVGLVHSGAKGSALGIVGAAVAAMRESFGSRPENITALLSPCIRPPLYEVDFAAQIRRQCQQAGVGQVIDPLVCTGSHVERYYSYRMEKGRTGRMLAVLALGI